MLHRLALALASLAFLGLTSCKGSCRELAERVCDCQSSTLERDACNQDAARAEGIANPTSEDSDRCEALLEVCQPADDSDDARRTFCRRLDTAEGKQACGAARPPP